MKTFITDSDASKAGEMTREELAQMVITSNFASESLDGPYHSGRTIFAGDRLQCRRAAPHLDTLSGHARRGDSHTDRMDAIRAIINASIAG